MCMRLAWVPDGPLNCNTVLLAVECLVTAVVEDPQDLQNCMAARFAPVQRNAWSVRPGHLAAAPPSSVSRGPACAPLLGRTHRSHPSHTVRSTPSSSDPSGELRPQARVSAPPVPPAAVDGQTSTGAGSTSSSNGAGSTNGGAAHVTGPTTPGSSRSYSDMYRSKNTLYSSSSRGGSSSGAPTSSSSSSSKRPSQPSPGEPPLEPSSSSSSNGLDGQAVPAAPPPESPAASVEEALQKAQVALAAAESHLSSIETLQPQLSTRWAKALQVVKLLALAAATGGLLVTSHAFGLTWQWVSAVAAGVGVAGWGYRSSSLSRSGAISAAVVVAATLGCSLRFGVVLVAFFISSSKLTHYKEDMKGDLVPQEKRGGQRDWKQVLCNGGVPTVLAIAYGAMAGCLDLPLGTLPAVEAWRADILTLLMGGFLGYYACCCGDTWASELGSLSTDQPRLVTNLQPVRRGTHGAVTLLGLSASIAGGLFVGLVFYVAAIVSPTLWVFEVQHQAAVAQWRLIPLGLVAGLCGSLIDSLLGATLQFTGYDRAKQQLVDAPGPDVTRIAGMPVLTNNLVNLLSASITSAVTALFALMMFA